MIGFGKNILKRIRRRIITRSLVSSFRSRSEQEPRLLFAFTGLHGFWPGMGRGLFESEPIYRETVIRCCQLLEKEVSPIAYFEGANFESENYSPAAALLFHAIFQLALSELWRSKGVEPQATIGCSLGITTACYLNESLSL